MATTPPFPLLTDALLAAAGTPVTATERNVAELWDGQPTAPAAFTDTASPPLATLRGSRRAYVLLGQGATLRGVAATVQKRCLTPMAGWATLADATGLARLGLALWAPATEIGWGAARPLTAAEQAGAAGVGTLLPLPVWATGAGGNVTWHVDVERIRTALAATPTTAADPTVRRAGTVVSVLTSAIPLDRPVPPPGGPIAAAMTLRAELTAFVTGVGPGPAGQASFDAAAEGQRLARQCRWNPYAVLFGLLELTAVWGRIPAAADIAADTFVDAWWNGFTDTERTRFAVTSAGHAILRRLWLWWAVGYARTAVAPAPALRTLLGLASDDLEKRSPASVGTMEPPLDGKVDPTPITPWGPKAKPRFPTMAYGRMVPLRAAAYQRKHFGVGYAGTVSPAPYLGAATGPATGGQPLPFDDRVLALPPNPGSAAARRDDWGRVLLELSRSEGLLDASSAFDTGVFSVGYQQWTAAASEGSVLLQRLKKLGGPYYDLVVRALGIENGLANLADITVDTGISAGADVTDLDRTHYFYALRTHADPDRIAVAEKDAAGNALKTVDEGATKKAVATRLFDWHDVGNVRVLGARGRAFCARWTVAAQYGPEMWQAQAELGYHRIVRASRRLVTGRKAWEEVLKLPGMPVATQGAAIDVGASVRGLFDSETLMAAVVDIEINTPNHTHAAMRRAVVTAMVLAGRLGLTGLATAPPVDDRFRHLLLVTFLQERAFTANGAFARGAIIDTTPQRIVHQLGTEGLAADYVAMLRKMSVAEPLGVSMTRRVDWTVAP